MPPGQAKKVARGNASPTGRCELRRLACISFRLGAPPPVLRFVRVAADILLIADGTGMVVDAVEASSPL